MASSYAAGKIGCDEFNRRPGTLRRRKMGKHLQWSFDEHSEAFSSTRNQESIAAEGRLDGFYVVRTSLAEQLEPLHERLFELLGIEPHPAPQLSPPPDSGAAAPAKTPT